MDISAKESKFQIVSSSKYSSYCLLLYIYIYMCGYYMDISGKESKFQFFFFFFF